MRKNKEQEEYIDIFIGKRLRERRVGIGLSQQGLADLLNVSFQQVQKYESGKNSIGSSKLFKISKFLDIDINYFFEGIGEKLISDSFFLDSKESLEIVRAFSKLDKNIKKNILSLVKEIIKDN